MRLVQSQSKLSYVFSSDDYVESHLITYFSACTIFNRLCSVQYFCNFSLLKSANEQFDYVGASEQHGWTTWCFIQRYSQTYDHAATSEGTYQVGNLLKKFKICYNHIQWQLNDILYSICFQISASHTPARNQPVSETLNNFQFQFLSCARTNWFS